MNLLSLLALSMGKAVNPMLLNNKAFRGPTPSKHKGTNKATAICTIGYFHGSDLIIARGVVHGQAVEPRGDTGFGFDCSFLPDGQDLTFGQMPRGLKDKVSHRALAIQDLVHQLRAL